MFSRCDHRHIACRAFVICSTYPEKGRDMFELLIVLGFLAVIMATLR
jgi:hypothetical protein